MWLETLFRRPGRRNRKGFVFYATNDAYAVSVMVFVHELRKHGIRPDADVIVLHLNVSDHLLQKMPALGIIARSVQPLDYLSDDYFRDCLVKLRIFELTEYERLVYADADALPLKSLDYLLSVPFEGPVAAPAAYWLPQPKLSSALMIVRPSSENWMRGSRHFETACARHLFDMDIINLEFSGEIHTLPDSLFCIDSEWEVSERPSYFPDKVQAFQKLSLVHFTALGKPWMFSVDETRRLRPDADPIFYELRKRWHKTRDVVLN